MPRCSVSPAPTAPPPSLFACFAGDVKRLDLHVRRFDAASLPQEEEALASWAVDRFREKDELLEARRTTGSFPGPVHGGRVTVKEWLTSEEQLPAWASEAEAQPDSAPLIAAPRSLDPF